MIDAESLIASVSRLQAADLEAWIKAELIVPHQDAGESRFSDMECARVRLIATLHYDLELAADALPLVLSLIDQLYDTRQRLLSLANAVAKQDPLIRNAILAATTGARPDLT